MRGVGFECDNCGHRVVVPSPYPHHDDRQAPTDWLVVAAQPTEPHVASDLTHLCSMACLANWSACKAEAELR